MRTSSPAKFAVSLTHGSRERGGARPLLLGTVCFLLGLGLSAFWFNRPAGPSPAPDTLPPLPENLKSALGRLAAPAELRFYAVLDPAGVSEVTGAYAKRVEALLARYQEQSGGKLKVVRYDASSPTNTDAAVADGMKRLTGSNGQDSFLGLCAVVNGHKDSLPELSPEWEAAFPSDLARLIGRVADAVEAATPAPPAIDPAATKEVKRLIPDPAAVSLEEGNQLIRAMALKDFAAAAGEMQAQLAEAQKKVTEAEASGSEADRQAAVNALRQVQAEQTEKLKAISAKSKAQVDAFAKLKAGR